MNAIIGMIITAAIGTSIALALGIVVWRLNEVTGDNCRNCSCWDTALNHCWRRMVLTREYNTCSQYERKTEQPTADGTTDLGEGGLQ